MKIKYESVKKFDKVSLINRMNFFQRILLLLRKIRTEGDTSQFNYLTLILNSPGGSKGIKSEFQGFQKYKRKRLFVFLHPMKKLFLLIA
jgi:hypothetical protein